MPGGYEKQVAKPAFFALLSFSECALSSSVGLPGISGSSCPDNNFPLLNVHRMNLPYWITVFNHWKRSWVPCALARVRCCIEQVFVLYAAFPAKSRGD
jgi:hypothetical protein